MDQRASNSIKTKQVPLILVIGYAIALGGLAWVVHDVDWRILWSDVRQLNVIWLVPAVLADVGTYVAQGCRWSLLLAPVGDLSPFRATVAIYIGLFTNEVMPLRLGEIVRTYLVSRWLGVAVPRVVSSVAVERLLDGFCLVTAIALAAIFVRLPLRLEHTAGILGIFVLVAAVLLVVFAFAKWGEGPNHSAPGVFSWLRASVVYMKNEFKAIAGSKRIFEALTLSPLLLLSQALAFWFVMKAYHLNGSLSLAMVVVLVVRIGTMIPNTPANIGSFQFFCVLGLTIFGVDKTVATGFSFVVFLVLTIPLWALGLAALVREGLTYDAIRKQDWLGAAR